MKTGFRGKFMFLEEDELERERVLHRRHNRKTDLQVRHTRTKPTARGVWIPATVIRFFFARAPEQMIWKDKVSMIETGEVRCARASWRSIVDLWQ